MRWIVGSSLRFRYIIVGIAAAFLFFGTQQVRGEKVDVFPEFAPTRVEIQTACVGLSSSEVEELVSVPLEDALNGVPGVDVIRSSSVPQLSSIELLFKGGTNYVRARQLVQERLQTVVPTLPTWAAPPFMMQPVSATSRIMTVGLTSNSMSLVDNGPGLMLVIEKFQGANTLDVTKGVENALDDLRPGLPGIQIHENIFRPASFIETAIHNLGIAVLIGCALVVLVLVLFLYEWRAALVSLLAIPLSLVAAALVLHLRGATINTMILAGFAVAVGVVVDDAIIDMENVVRRLRTRREQGERTSIGRVVLEASLEVRGAILYATLINVVAVLPVIFISGLTGSFFRPLALSYALAVLASMVVALTITPALALILLGGKPPRRREPPVVKVLKRGYERLLWPLVRAPRMPMAAAAVVAAGGLAVLPALGQDLFPTFKERDFLMHWVSKPGSSIQEERRIVTRAGARLRAVPGVRGFGSHIGQAWLGEEIAGPNFGENWVSIDPHADYDKTIDRLRAVADNTPGLFRDVQTYLRERIDEVLAGSTAAIVVRIFGDKLGTLSHQ